MDKVWLYLGGTRSGKSVRAEQQAALLAEGAPVLYVATAECWSGEGGLAERIARHRARRPSFWKTLECSRAVAGCIENSLRVSPVSDSGPHVILLDCVTLWLTSLLFSLPKPELESFEALIQEEVGALISLMQRTDCLWVLVSGETGLGGVASDAIGRMFQDGLGVANQLLAEASDKVFLCVAGRTLALEP